MANHESPALPAAPVGEFLSRKWFWAGCALLTTLYFCAALFQVSNLPFPDPDEPRYAGAGRTMARGGSLLIPEFNGEPRINKPPLFYWLVALSDKLFGEATETSSRAPSVAMGLLMLWGTIWLGRKLFGPATGLTAGLVLASTPLFIALSRCCITDMTLSTFLAAALGALMLGMLGMAPSERSGWIASVFFGLAVLTKATAAFPMLLVGAIERAIALPADKRPAAARWIPGMLCAAVLLSGAALICELKGAGKHAPKRPKPAAAQEISTEVSGDDAPVEAGAKVKNVWTTLDGILNKLALLLAVAAVRIVCVMAYRAERLAPVLPPRWKLCLLLSISMGLWWYILLIATQGWPRFSNLLSFELAGRMEGATHREGMHYYLLLLPAVAFPWSPGLPSVLGLAWPMKSAAGLPETVERRAERFLLAWVLGIVWFFSIPGAKLPTYVLPAMPALALLTARLLLKLSRPLPQLNSTVIFSTQCIAGILVAGLLTFPFYAGWLPGHVHEFIANLPVPLWVFSVCAALLPGAWLLAVRGFGRQAAALAGVGTFVVLLFSAPGVIAFLTPRSTKQICINVGPALSDCKSIKTIGVAPEGLSYYLNKTVTRIKWAPPAANETGIDLLSNMLSGPQPTAIFLEKRIVPRIFGKDTELNSVTPETMARILPARLEYVYSDQNVLVIRNKSAQ